MIKKQYRKRNINTRDVKGIDRQLAHAQDARCGEDEELITANDAELGVDKKYHLENLPYVRTIRTVVDSSTSNQLKRRT